MGILHVRFQKIENGRMEILRFNVFQVKESFICTCLDGCDSWTCRLPPNGHRAVLLSIWNSTQHVPAQSTKSHPVFIEIMGVLIVKGSDGGGASYCVLLSKVA